jgi:hypothetical protein
MKKIITGFVVAQQYPWDDEPSFTFIGFDPVEHEIDNYIPVCAHSFEIEIPNDFDVRPHQIATLEKKKRELREKFAMAVKEVDDRINSLLAINNSVKVVDDGTAN